VKGIIVGVLILVIYVSLFN